MPQSCGISCEQAKVSSKPSISGQDREVVRGLVETRPHETPALLHGIGAHTRLGGDGVPRAEGRDVQADAVGAAPLPAVVRADDRLTLDRAGREIGAAVGTPDRGHRGSPRLGAEDRQLLTEQGRRPRCVEILQAGDRKPGASQGEVDVLAARHLAAHPAPLSVDCSAPHSADGALARRQEPPSCDVSDCPGAPRPPRAGSGRLVRWRAGA